VNYTNYESPFCTTQVSALKTSVIWIILCACIAFISLLHISSNQMAQLRLWEPRVTVLWVARLLSSVGGILYHRVRHSSGHEASVHRGQNWLFHHFTGNWSSAHCKTRLLFGYRNETSGKISACILCEITVSYSLDVNLLQINTNVFVSLVISTFWWTLVAEMSTKICYIKRQVFNMSIASY
jgi:hypothetical protein